MLPAKRITQEQISEGGPSQVHKRKTLPYLVKCPLPDWHQSGAQSFGLKKEQYDG